MEEIPSEHYSPENFKMQDHDIAKMRDLFDRMKGRKSYKLHSNKILEFHAVSFGKSHIIFLAGTSRKMFDSTKKHSNFWECSCLRIATFASWEKVTNLFFFRNTRKCSESSLTCTREICRKSCTRIRDIWGRTLRRNLLLRKLCACINCKLSPRTNVARATNSSRTNSPHWRSGTCSTNKKQACWACRSSENF